MKKSTDAESAGRFPRPFLVAVAALVALVVVLSAVASVRSVAAKRRLEHSFETITRTYPTLAFERVRFSKYVARGTLPGNDPHFSYLDVFLVRGVADIQFDVSRFAADPRRTNYLSRTLVLAYTGEGTSFVDADIHIDPSGVTLAESIDPAPFTKDERAAIKDFLAVPAAAVGGGIGAVAASSIPAPPVLKYAGGFGSLLNGAAGALAGGAAGAVAGAGAVYLFTDNFLSAMQPRANANLSMMEMIAAAKPLIGTELVCGDRDSAEVERLYRAEFAARMGEIARNFGWKKVIVDFGGTR